MIYLVTKNQELFDNDIYKIISVDESLHLLSKYKNEGILTVEDVLFSNNSILTSEAFVLNDWLIAVNMLIALLYRVCNFI